MGMTIRQLAACRRQTEQMEQDAEHLSLNVAEKNRLKAMLKTAREALDNAERLLQSELGDGKECVAKLQLWERKLLDLSLRSNLEEMGASFRQNQYQRKREAYGLSLPFCIRDWVVFPSAAGSLAMATAIAQVYLPIVLWLRNYSSDQSPEQGGGSYCLRENSRPWRPWSHSSAYTLDGKKVWSLHCRAIVIVSESCLP